MRNRSLRVLAYHRVLEPSGGRGVNPSLISSSPDGFEWQMRYLAATYRVVSMEDVLGAVRSEAEMPSRAVLITFDDGYRDFADVAWPIMRELGLPATLFVPTAHASDPARVFWWDRIHDAIERTTEKWIAVTGVGEMPLSTSEERRQTRLILQERIKRTPHAAAMELVESVCRAMGVGVAPASESLSWPQLRILAGEGVTIAAHTRSHASMPHLDGSEMLLEVEGSLADVRREIGAAAPVFCYPFGLHDDRCVRAVKNAGIEVALTCLPGHNEFPASEPLLLRRTVVTLRSSPVLFGLRLTAPGGRIDRLRLSNRQAQERRPVGGAGRPRVAVVMSRFPKLSETFVLNEMIELERQGVKVEVFPLLRERQEVSHPEAEGWVRRAHFQPFVSLAILRAHLSFLAREPVRYLRVLGEVLSGTAGSANFFVGAIAIFPKSVWFAREMRRRGVTHVHAHFATHPAVAALIVHRLTGIPFSFTAHGSDLHVDRRMLATKLAAAAFGVTVSEFNRDVMVSECGEWARAKVHVIHCGVDTDFFAPAERKPDSGAFSIVCIASLEEVKGHRFLIEACARLQTAGIDFHCDLVGDGPLRSEIEAQIRAACIEDRVVLHGGRTRDQVRAILPTADVAMLTSFPTAEGKREGIPVALMEAMSCGMPVIASDLSGIPELVLNGVTGILVPPGDVDAIAAALTRLSRDVGLRERLGAAGRERVIREFTVTRTTARLVSLLTGGEVPDFADAGLDPAAVVAPRDRLPSLVTAEPV